MKKLLIFATTLSILSSCSKQEEIVPVVDFKPELVSTNNTNPADQLDSRVLSVKLEQSILDGKQVYMNSLDANGNACMNCHISRDGFDIARFNNSDTIPFMNRVFHRALIHVTVKDATDVMNYIKSLTKNGTATPINSTQNVFQPGFETTSESALGIELGLTNPSYTVEQINSWDFMKIKIPMKLPAWFTIENNTDWMPDRPIQLMKKGDESFKNSYKAYLDNPTDENFVRFKRTVFNTLTEADKHPGEHGDANFEESYNTMRWMSSAYMQHVIRYRGGKYGPFNMIVDGKPTDTRYETVMDPIWLAGNTARRSLDNGTLASQLPNRDEIKATWLYMGWVGNYGKTVTFESQYIGTALTDKGYNNLAAAVILKSMVNRPDNCLAIYDDIRSIARFVKQNSGMYEKSVDFALTFVLNKLKNSPSSMTVMGTDKKYSLEALLTTKWYIEEKGGATKQELLAKLKEIDDLVSAM